MDFHVVCCCLVFFAIVSLCNKRKLFNIILDNSMRLCEIYNMFNQARMDRFRRWRAGNFERDMGGVTSGFLAFVRLILLTLVTWVSLWASSAIFMLVLWLIEASMSSATVLLGVFVFGVLIFSCTQCYSRMIATVVAFFEEGFLPRGVRCFGRLVFAVIQSIFSQYISPVHGVPTAPPKSLA